ncbi:zinc finger protein 628-like [Haliotis rufescens]|uniref:zinc finger protein 628-like n=1 Tax=Haliotis rufescens TaxID=6454 RepID=UPI00201EF51D|nr:zinc finger protein 628-like [Haliotis rufescens]
MKEECDTGYFSSSDISRVTPDGDIADDVLDSRPDSPSSDMSEKRPVENTVFATPVIPDYKPEFTSLPIIPQIVPEIFKVNPEVNHEVHTSSNHKHKNASLQTSDPSSYTLESLPKKKPHQEPGNYECLTCGKVFAWKTGLVTHKRVHTGERPYKCPVCPKAFSDYSTCSKHCRIHSGHKPYSCDVCGKAFTQSGSSNNRYRSKCPGPLSLQPTQRFQPYQRPSHSLRFAPKSDCVSPLVQTRDYVPTPPCPAPGTWANTFSFDDYSTKVWATDMFHQQRLQVQTALIQREILMSTPGINPYPSCTYTPRASTPITPYGVYDNLAHSIMKEECDTGYFSSSDISRVTPDGDIADDVLDSRPDSPSSDMSEKRPVENTVFATPVIPDYKPEFTSLPIIPQIVPEIFKVNPEVNHEVHTSSNHKHKNASLQTSDPSSYTLESLPKKKPHQEPGNYECLTCGKVFAWKTGLVTHKRVHTGERPYNCDVCGKAFTQSGNRLRHMRTVHEVTLWKPRNISCDAKQIYNDIRSSNNRYRSKCPGPLSLQPTQRFQPYQRPSHSLRFAPKSDCVSPLVQTRDYVPTPPCPAPGTWANTFSFDDYSTKVWATDMFHQQRLQVQTALIQREILMSTPGINPYPSCTYTPRASTPITPYGVYDNLAHSIMKEECDTGYFSSSDISRVTPDGDIADDVLDSRPDSPSSDMSEKRPVENTVFATPVIPDYKPEFTSLPIIPQIVPEIFKVNPEVNHEVHTSSNHKHKNASLQTSDPSSYTLESLPKKKPHQEPGNYECLTCGKVFAWKTGLVTHKRVHTGERPYKCPVCPKAFSDYSTYSKHCRIHSGHKPYSCDVCGKAFTQSGNRLRHMRTVHKVTL